MSARAFDSYIAIDWSARATRATGADSIWIAVLDVPDPGGRRDGASLANPPTRFAAEAYLRALLDERPDRRVLMGVDVALGYPAGTAVALGLPVSEVPWRAVWRRIAELIVDDEHNSNNRFAVAAALNQTIGGAPGPFWGCPRSLQVDGLEPVKPSSFALAEFRAAERSLRAAGRRPLSVWQLTGAGSVGSQTLTAIPVLERLLTGCDRQVDVWPFTTGLTPPPTSPGGVVLAEVWPTAFDPPMQAGLVRDAAQVRHVAEQLCDADLDGRLGRWFAPALGGATPAEVTSEEGWVLGPAERPDRT